VQKNVTFAGFENLLLSYCTIWRA